MPPPMKNLENIAYTQMRNAVRPPMCAPNMNQKSVIIRSNLENHYMISGMALSPRYNNVGILKLYCSVAHVGEVAFIVTYMCWQSTIHWWSCMIGPTPALASPTLSPPRERLPVIMPLTHSPLARITPEPASPPHSPAPSAAILHPPLSPLTELPPLRLSPHVSCYRSGTVC